MSTNPTDQSPFQVIMGGRITKFVMWGTIIIALTGISFAIVALTSDEEKVKSAFSILQYVFGALLPLWGTWIGTILAYYYSKDNFESANRSVQQMVDKITTDKKLQNVKAKDVMIPRSKLIVQVLPQGKDLSQFKLKESCIDFLRTNKIKRMIILNDQDHALYVLHRDLISYFIAEQTIQGNSIDAYTLKDMYEKASPEMKTTIENSVRFISEDSNLYQGKIIMDQNRSCQDVFITKTGAANEPVLGWITNVTIMENSVV